MKQTIATIAVAALVAGQATVAFAATKDDARVVKASVSSCATPKATKLTHRARVENRCQMDSTGGIGGVPLPAVIFTAALVAGAATVAAVTTTNNSSTSP